jgi:hypothetical protein
MQEGSALERASHSRGQRAVVNPLGMNFTMPEERRAASVCPFSIESRRQRERIALIDMMHAGDKGIVRREQLSKPASRSGLPEISVNVE